VGGRLVCALVVERSIEPDATERAAFVGAPGYREPVALQDVLAGLREHLVPLKPEGLGILRPQRDGTGRAIHLRDRLLGVRNTMGSTTSFLLRCHHVPTAQYRATRTQAFQAWIEVTGVARAA